MDIAIGMVYQSPTISIVITYGIGVLALKFMALFAQAELEAMIEESTERQKQQEEVMRERAEREEERMTRAVVSLQVAARGYLTRKKTTPRLMALRERKRLEEERERRAATAIQAVWRGYRSVSEIVSI